MGPGLPHPNLLHIKLTIHNRLAEAEIKFGCANPDGKQEKDLRNELHNECHALPLDWSMRHSVDHCLRK